MAGPALQGGECSVVAHSDDKLFVKAAVGVLKHFTMQQFGLKSVLR